MKEAENEIKALNVASSNSSKALENEGGDIEKKRKELESCKQILADTKRKKDEYLVSRSIYLINALLSQQSPNAAPFYSLLKKIVIPEQATRCL